MSRHLVYPAVIAGVLLSGTIPVAAQQAATEQSRQRNVITAEEIERLEGVEDAYQVVLRLRPEFFRVRARSQFRAPMPSPEENPRDKPGASAQPSLSVTRAPGGGQAPDPDAPEFTSGRTGGRTPAQRGGAVSGGEASSGVLTGGSPQPRVGMMGPSHTEETGIAVYVAEIPSRTVLLNGCGGSRTRGNFRHMTTFVMEKVRVISRPGPTVDKKQAAMDVSVTQP